MIKRRGLGFIRTCRLHLRILAAAQTCSRIERDRTHDFNDGFHDLSLLYQGSHSIEITLIYVQTIAECLKKCHLQLIELINRDTTYFRKVSVRVMLVVQEFGRHSHSDEHHSVHVQRRNLDTRTHLHTFNQAHTANVRFVRTLEVFAQSLHVRFDRDGWFECGGEAL